MNSTPNAAPVAPTSRGFQWMGAADDNAARLKSQEASSGLPPFRFWGDGQPVAKLGNSTPGNLPDGYFPANHNKSWMCRKLASAEQPICQEVQPPLGLSEQNNAGALVQGAEKKQKSNGAAKPSAPSSSGGKSEPSSKVNGSKIIGIFKVTSALVVTGAVNAFFFGVPIYVSSGIAAAVAGAQALAALKIHKEDTPFTQKLMTWTRKIMGRENDLTPAGKEWSMVPVWAGICGAFGLSEAFLNHLFKESTGYRKKSFEDRKNAIVSEIQRSRFGLKRAILGQQLKGMTLVESSRQGLMRKLSQWAQQENPLGKALNKTAQLLKRFNNGGAARPNYPLIYLWSLGMASFAGATQTVIAALMQQKIDRANGVGKAS